jgi:hypothetical protein
MDTPLQMHTANVPAAYKQTVCWLALAGGALAIGALLVFGIYNAWMSSSLQAVILKQFGAIVGLPCAALAALVIVLVLEGAAGPIKFSVVGLTFEGAAAPIVFWVMCFAAIALAIKLLWLP